jgi:hypothetical protein
MAEKVENKCAVVVSDSLETGLAINAASVLSLTLGHRVEGLVGIDVKDADGVVHPGIAYVPIPVLKTDFNTVGKIVQSAASDDQIFFVSFSALAQSCRVYEDYIERMAATPTAELAIIGVGLYGPRKRINKLVGSLPLMR